MTVLCGAAPLLGRKEGEQREKKRSGHLKSTTSAVEQAGLTSLKGLNDQAGKGSLNSA